MKLIFVRHGSAEDKNKKDTLMDDFRRRLTKDGAQEVKEVVHSCYFIFRKINTIFTSPLSRAVQTASIVYSENHKSDYEILSTLDPFHTPEDFVNSIQDLQTSGTYCFVGHEPQLSQSINLILNQVAETKIEFAKGGVAVLEGETLSSLVLTTLLSPRMMLKLDF